MILIFISVSVLLNISTSYVTVVWTYYDIVVVMYANSLKEYGKNNQLYWDKVNGIEEQKALAEVGYECSNRRTYSSTQIFGY